MKTYEYATVEISSNLEFEVLGAGVDGYKAVTEHDAMGELGEKGYELVTVLPGEAGSVARKLYFKRGVMSS